MFVSRLKICFLWTSSCSQSACQMEALYKTRKKIYEMVIINSLTPGKRSCWFRNNMFKHAFFICTWSITTENSLRGGMAPSGVIFHENVNFLFVAQKCQVIHAFHKIHKQNMIAVSETHTLRIFINDMVFGDQRVSTKNPKMVSSI